MVCSSPNKRFSHLRRVVQDENEKENKDKPTPCVVPQKEFRVEELALARHPETRKWSVVKVLEALPSGR